jgi:Zn finger protein HypA/HybF involved in hydrogenase expression
MHETVIADNIIKEAKKYGDIKEIFLEIGELASVPMNDLLPCIKTIVPWKVHAEETKAACTCACGYSGHPSILERGHDAFIIECPECKEVPLLTRGTDIIITKVIV